MRRTLSMMVKKVDERTMFPICSRICEYTLCHVRLVPRTHCHETAIAVPSERTSRGRSSIVVYGTVPKEGQKPMSC
jgi:hypothetical protein